MFTKTRLDAPLLKTPALRAVRRLALAQKRKAVQASLPEWQHLLGVGGRNGAR